MRNHRNPKAGDSLARTDSPQKHAYLSDLSSQPTHQNTIYDCCSPPWMRRILPLSRESAWSSRRNEDRDDDEENQTVKIENDFGKVLVSPLECKGLFAFEQSDLHLETNEPPAVLTHWPLSKVVGEDRKQQLPGSPTTTISTQEESSDDDEKSDTTISRDYLSFDLASNDSYFAELAPESSEDLLHCPRILTNAMIHQLHHFLPQGLKMNPWERCFAIGRDGDSFIKLLDSCSAYTFSILVIRTVQGHVVGGFASQPWQAQDGFTKRGAYYGTGQSFLFGSCPEERITGLDAEPGSTPANLEAPLQIFSWTGSNDYCQICDTSRQVVCMGGGGDFGWIIRDHFARGQTGRCRTYKNPPLVPGGLFEIADVEVYGLQSIFDSSLISSSSRTL